MMRSHQFCYPAPSTETRRLVLASLAATVLLAGCGSAPPRQRSSARAGSNGSLRRSTPDLAVRNPLRLPASLREEAVARAMLTINTPYTFGGNTLEGGFDCSGLVQYVFNGLAKRSLPRSTIQWASSSLPLSDARQLQRGDLVFFNTSGQPFSHMGIYIGQHQFVHAPSSGGTVRTATLDNRYFAPRFDGGRSVFA